MRVTQFHIAYHNSFECWPVSCDYRDVHRRCHRHQSSSSSSSQSWTSLKLTLLSTIEYSIECSIQNKYKLEAASHVISEAFHLTQLHDIEQQPMCLTSYPINSSYSWDGSNARVDAFNYIYSMIQHGMHHVCHASSMTCMMHDMHSAWHASWMTYIMHDMHDAWQASCMTCIMHDACN